MLYALGSALCFTLPFVLPALWPLLLFSSLFFFIRHCSMFHAATWGIVCAAGPCMPVCHALYLMATGPWYLRIAPGLFLILYCTSILTIWAWYTTRIPHPLGIILSYWGMLLFMIYGLAFPLTGQWYGAFFYNPALILPPFCSSTVLCTLWLCAASSCIALALIHASRLWWCMSTLLILGIWLSNPPPSAKRRPDWLDSVAYLSIIIAGDPAPIIDHYTQLHPQLEVIIMPESACQGPLPKHVSTPCMIAGFLENNANGACRIANGQCEWYPKQHLFPFVEYIPSWWKALGGASPFSGCAAARIHKVSKPRWLLAHDQHAIPSICSELLCAQSPSDSYTDPILALINDRWFAMPHFTQLMYRAAQKKAGEWQRPILYISYRYGVYFDSYGNEYEIERL